MAGELPLFGPALQVLALVVQLLRFGERDRDLGDAVLEVQLERDDGEALTARAADQLADLVRVEQQLARAGGRGGVVAPPQLCRDRHGFEPHLTSPPLALWLAEA